MGVRVVNVRGLKGEDRKPVCYVGRAFAGWPATPWGNPFKLKSYGNGGACQNAQQAWQDKEVARVVALFTNYAAKQPHSWWEVLFEASEQGTKPLGCWCVNAAHGDGQPFVCHAQVLAAGLHERFMMENTQ